MTETAPTPPEALDALPIGTIIAARTWPDWLGADEPGSLETLRWERVDPDAPLSSPTWTSHKLPWSALDDAVDGNRRGATSADLVEHGDIEVLAVPLSEPTDAQREAAMGEAWGFRAKTRSMQERWDAEHWFDAGWRAALRAAGGAL